LHRTGKLAVRNEVQHPVITIERCREELETTTMPQNSDLAGIAERNKADSCGPPAGLLPIGDFNLDGAGGNGYLLPTNSRNMRLGRIVDLDTNQIAQ